MTQFDDDTHLTPIDAGRYSVDVSGRWSVGAGANGGYVAGLLAKALIAASDAESGNGDTGDRHLRSLTAHLLSPAMAGPATLDTRVLRSGRSATVIDVDRFVERKHLALATHASQIAESFWSQLPVEAFGRLFGEEAFIRAYDTTGATVPETDIFTGLR